MKVRGRFAPTPSGRLHLGNARTALLAWTQVRRLGGVFVLRVEDVDPVRCRPALESDQLEDLRWLGIDWDEGPDLGGGFGPYRQSERGEIYAEAAARLSTFPCSCTRRELRASGGGPYAGTCAERPAQPHRPLALRWDPGPACTRFEDACAGVVEERVKETVGACVVRRTDGVWSYQLAVAVDDLRMEMTHILRGADLLDSTARQLAIMEALSPSTPASTDHGARPRYAHVPVIHGPDGRKLSKRHGAPDLTALREGGADPTRVVAFLARSMGMLTHDVRSARPQDLVSTFRLEDVARAPRALDPELLEEFREFAPARPPSP